MLINPNWMKIKHFRVNRQVFFLPLQFITQHTMSNPIVVICFVIASNRLIKVHVFLQMCTQFNNIKNYAAIENAFDLLFSSTKTESRKGKNSFKKIFSRLCFFTQFVDARLNLIGCYQHSRKSLYMCLS